MGGDAEQPREVTLAELHRAVRAFVDARGWGRYHSPRNLAMAVSVEAAELLELFLWTSDDGPQPATPERARAVADEAADVMICLLNLCDRSGIDLGAAVFEKLAKTEQKYPVSRVYGKALKYDEYADRSDDHSQPNAEQTTDVTPEKS